MKFLNILLLFGLMLFSVSCSKDSEDDMNEDFSEKVGESNGFVCYFNRYMNMPQSGNDSQAAACYGDLMVQAYGDNSKFLIYDLAAKKHLATIPITEPESNSRVHCNSICFGNQKADPADEIPVLYVSSGYKTNGLAYIYAYRILRTNGQYTAQLVQTISLKGFGSWTEGLCDIDGNYLWIRHNGGNQKFNLPDITEKEVTIDLTDQLETLSYKNIIAPDFTFGDWQAQMFYKDRMNFVSGVPSKGQNLAFASINTQTKEMDILIDLAEIGMIPENKITSNHYEPEGVFFYKGKCMICFHRFLYQLDFGGI